jgi:hypothetical protein
MIRLKKKNHDHMQKNEVGEVSRLCTVASPDEGPGEMDVAKECIWMWLRKVHPN